jgi:hypothetical protein
MESGESVKRTSAQVRSEEGEKSFSSLAKISPSLVEPKKAVQEAAQITCFERGSQGEFAILWPSVSKRGKVTTLLVDETVVDNREWCSAPRRSRARILSLSKWSLDMPLRWCANLREDK